MIALRIRFEDDGGVAGAGVGDGVGTTGGVEGTCTAGVADVTGAADVVAGIKNLLIGMP